MAIAEIVNRRIVIAAQSALGTIAATGAASARTIPFRPGSAGGLQKDSFSSDSIRPDHQYLVGRHGMRSGSFSLEQELQPGAHTAVLSSLLRAGWATPSTTGAQTNIGVNASTRTISRAAGSFVTDGFKVGDVVGAAGFATAANNGKPLRLLTVAALSMTYAADPQVTGANALVTESAGASVTIAATRKIQVPNTGHTKTYLTVEDWLPDVPQSERMVDALCGSASFDIQPGQMATATFNLIARDVQQGTTAYFSAPAASPTVPTLSGPVGVVRIGGTDSVVVTNVSLTIDGQAEVRPVVGANVSPDVFRSGLRVSGSFAAMFDATTFRDQFDAEATTSLYITLYTDSTSSATAMVFKMPLVKIMACTKSVDGPIVNLSCDFQSGYVDPTTVVEGSSIVIQDSAVTTTV